MGNIENERFVREREREEKMVKCFDKSKLLSNFQEIEFFEKGISENVPPRIFIVEKAKSDLSPLHSLVKILVFLDLVVTRSETILPNFLEYLPLL